jgi:ubiquinone/menaquinone biosynthesis C-methylase UbiE
VKQSPYDTREGRVVVVSRHPRAGREIAAFGGARRFRGRTVLDIGTGNGRLAFDAARYARRVVGVDPSEGAIEIARRKADALDVRNIEFRVGSAQRLDVVKERFDIAIFSWSL